MISLVLNLTELRPREHGPGQRTVREANLRVKCFVKVAAMLREDGCNVAGP